MSNYKVIIFLLISFSLSFGCSSIKRVEEKNLCINLYGEKEITIPIIDEIKMMHASGYLCFADGDISYEIPVDNIKNFCIVNDPAILKNISSDKEQNWTIYDMNGRIWGKGEGQLPVDKLIKGNSYIVIREGDTLKIHIK